MAYRLDDKDHRIIEVLRGNSRSSVREIAKKSNLRPSTVHQRIQRMKQEGIIERFTLKLNNQAAGENFVVFMFVATEGEIDDSAFIYPCIKEVFGITGEYDLLIKMKFPNVEEFNAFILNFRKKYNLKKTVTMVGTIVIKEEI